MEVLKTFESLSDTDKIKFFEVLGSISESKATTSVSNEDSEKSPTVPQNANFNKFLEQLKSGAKKAPEENVNAEITSPTSESKVKQKTLDSWLIRRGGSKDKVSTGKTSQDANANINSDVVASSSSASTSLQSSDICSAEKIVSSSVTKSADSTIVKHNVPMTCDQPTISPNSTEPCNLRRSKRKCSKWSSYDTLDNSNKNKRNSDGQKSQKNIKLDEDARTNKADGKNLLSGDPSIGLSFENVAPDKMHVVSNSIQSVGKNVNGVSNISSPDKSKASYHLRANRKISKKLQDALELKKCVSHSIYNHRTGATEEHATAEDIAPTVPDSSSEANYIEESYNMLSAECKRFGLDVNDILLNENIQKLLSNYVDNACGDAVILVGHHKTSTGEIVPIVYSHSSKSKLSERLDEVRKTLNLKD